MCNMHDLILPVFPESLISHQIGKRYNYSSSGTIYIYLVTKYNIFRSVKRESYRKISSFRSLNKVSLQVPYSLQGGL